MAGAEGARETAERRTGRGRAEQQGLVGHREDAGFYSEEGGSHGRV